MANGYGEWMNNLSGMTSALGAASPYAQQLAAQNAAQMALASQIRSGLPQFGFGQGYGYQPPTSAPPAVGGVGGAPQPTPFTGFADLIASKQAARLSPQPYPNPPAISGGVTGTGEQPDEGPSFAPYESGDRTFKEWWDVMKGLPGFVGQFTPGGMARDVYRSGKFDPLLRGIGLGGLTAAEDRIDDLSSPDTNFGQPRTTPPQDEVSKWARALAQAAEAEQWGLPSIPAPLAPQLPPSEIISRSPNALGGTYPIPEVDIEQLGLLYEPSPIPTDEVYQQWLSDQINAGAAQEESGPQWWEQPQSEEEY